MAPVRGRTFHLATSRGWASRTSLAKRLICAEIFLKLNALPGRRRYWYLSIQACQKSCEVNSRFHQGEKLKKSVPKSGTVERQTRGLKSRPSVEPWVRS